MSRVADILEQAGGAIRAFSVGGEARWDYGCAAFLPRHAAVGLKKGASRCF
jgi:hypothetical protein